MRHPTKTPRLAFPTSKTGLHPRPTSSQPLPPYLPSKISVGAKRLAHKPDATQAQIERLAQRDPEEAVQAPNISPELFLKLAQIYPVEATQNPSLPLFLMENDFMATWVSMERTGLLFQQWVPMAFARLQGQARDLFALDCYWHILPLYEKLYPKDKRPRQIFATMKSYLGDGFSMLVEDGSEPYHSQGVEPSDLLDAHQLADGVFHDREGERKGAKGPTLAKATFGRQVGLAALGLTGESLDIEDIKRITHNLSVAAAEAAVYAKRNKKAWDEGYLEESRWQFNCALAYLYGKPEEVGAMAAWDDPRLSDDEIRRRAESDPRFYRNPNCSFDTLCLGAVEYPHEVAMNPVLPLLSLESPSLYVALQDCMNRGWVSFRFLSDNITSDQDLRRICLDAATLTLPVFEGNGRYGEIVEEAIEIGYLFLRGEATEQEMLAASTACCDLQTAPIHHELEASAMAVRFALSTTVKIMASRSLEHANAALGVPYPECSPAIAELVKKYFYAKHPEYLPQDLS